MTNLQNAILEACNDDIITTHEANTLLESSYYSIPILKSSERLPMSVIGMAKGYIQSMAKMTDCRNFCISVQRTFLPNKRYRLPSSFKNRERFRGTAYYDQFIYDENSKNMISIIDTDAINAKDPSKWKHPFNVMFGELIDLVGHYIPYSNDRTFDGFIFYGHVDEYHKIDTMVVMNHYINGKKPVSKQIDFAGFKGATMDELFVENTNSFMNESSGTTYDKVKWHTDNGEDEKEVHKRFKLIFSYLSKHKMLTDEGKEEYKLGISEDTIINRNMLTADGNKFMSKYYDEMLRLDIEDMKRKIEKI